MECGVVFGKKLLENRLEGKVDLGQILSVEIFGLQNMLVSFELKMLDQSNDSIDILRTFA